jgi:hypothetical protein
MEDPVLQPQATEDFDLAALPSTPFAERTSAEPLQYRETGETIKRFGIKATSGIRACSPGSHRFPRPCQTHAPDCISQPASAQIARQSE